MGGMQRKSDREPLYVHWQNKAQDLALYHCTTSQAAFLNVKFVALDTHSDTWEFVYFFFYLTFLQQTYRSVISSSISLCSHTQSFHVYYFVFVFTRTLLIFIFSWCWGLNLGPFLSQACLPFCIATMLSPQPSQIFSNFANQLTFCFKANVT